MYCIQCGQDNPNSAKFCMNCGASLQQVRGTITQTTVEIQTSPQIRIENGVCPMCESPFRFNMPADRTVRRIESDDYQEFLNTADQRQRCKHCDRTIKIYYRYNQ